MKKTLTFCEFCDEFSEDRKNQFSYEGKRALFDYLEEYAEETGEEVECDIVALCCEYSEYANFEEFKKDYTNIETMEELENRTLVIPLDDKLDGFIIQQF